ncbi:MAG: bifunctional methylenetetrahydrofolate dehydrogenase/methenyltetrahydrofolate cyclohydrolase FolD [Eubacteriales bacterium]
MNIDGKQLSGQLRQQIAADTASFVRERGYAPALTVIIVGDDQASATYVRNKGRACEEVGMRSTIIALPASTTEAALIALVKELNLDREVHGILVQLPLPAHIDPGRIIDTISPDKDVDALHPFNVGRLVQGNPTFLPCTPAGILAMLDAYHIDIAGKHCVIIGRSNIVGKPLALLMLHRNATVTVCHSKTKDLAALTRQADILVAAVGKEKLLRGDMVKEGAVVIDVGMNRNSEGKLCGDADYDTVNPRAAAITPVPGGVGPMTITMLLQNTLRAARGLHAAQDAEKNEKST